MSHAAASHRRILALFLCSGALGLGYQVLWSKFVLLFVGVSSWSYAIVLAAFMAGLALGSAWLGRLADRVPNRLKLFAFLELGIGLYAVAWAPLSSAAGDLYLRVASATADRPDHLPAILVKVALAGALLLPPTFLMGGTYPAMVRHAATRLDMVGRRAAQLYAINALGAVLGALAIAFVVLPWLGLRGSLMLLALGNAGVGLSALALARAADAEPSVDGTADAPALAEASAETPVPAPAPPPPVSPAFLPLMLFVGVLAFAYEIAWTRFFALVLGSSTYSFAVIVAAFVAGIALAGALVARVERRLANPLAFFGWTQVVAAALVVLPLPLYPLMTWAFGRLSNALPATAGGYVLDEALKLLICMLVMLPPAVLLGMSIPLAVKAVAADHAATGADAGRVYAWNTAGNVLGALVAGLVLLPFLGMESLLRTAAACTALAGVLLIALARPTSSLRRAGPFAAVVVLIAVMMPAWNMSWFTLVPFRREGMGDWQAARKRVAETEVVYSVDDPASTVTVMQAGMEGHVVRILLVNGKPDASSTGDIPTQVMLGQLPCLLQGAPKDVLVIGLASGVTSGAVLSHDVERLDVVDIVKAMPRATRLFDEWNGRPLDDPRMHVVVDDARSYLSTTRRSYDVVVSEPSNPWVAGTGSLFSRELYERAARRLKPGGVYCQWVQAYELSDATLTSIVATFRTAFPHVVIFQIGVEDLAFIGSLQPLDISRDSIARAITPAAQVQLTALNIGDPTDILYLEAFGPGTSDWIAALSPVLNTDDNLLLEHEAPRDLFMRRSPLLLERFDDRATATPSLPWTAAARAGADRLAPIRVMRLRYFGRRGQDAASVAALARITPGGLAAMPHDLVEPKAGAPAPPRPPTSDDEALATLTAAVQSADWKAVALFAFEERETLCVEALYSSESASRWEQALASAVAASPGPLQPTLGLLRADVLAAGGRSAEAIAQLDGLVATASEGDVLVRACRIDPGQACDTMARKLATLAPTPELERFIASRE